MDSDILKNLLYLSISLSLILTVILVDFRIRFLRLKQKNYFLKRDRQRYAETLYASKDGYFAFIYPDEAIRDPRPLVIERCSRRLAVMLDLKKGRDASFEDVLNAFYKDDARRLKKYLALMQEEGIVFEDTFHLKNIKKSVRIFANRINGSDGNLYCDMLWFRDLSPELLKIGEMEQNLLEKNVKINVLQDLFDHVRLPLYIRNDKLEIVAHNKHFEQLFLTDTKTGQQWQEISNDLAQKALQTNQSQNKKIQMIVNKEARYFEVFETPFHNADELDKIGTVGYLVDTTELDQIKRDFKIHQNAHLEVLSSLGSAFAIFNTDSELVFYNKAFKDLWGLDSALLDKKLSYVSFLNAIYNRRLLPEVSDFKAYKSDEEKLFGSLIEPKENLLHLPDGRTIRRLISPHPNGIIFAFEDVTDKLAAERTIHELMSVQQNILDHAGSPILIFGQDAKLRYHNEAYLKLFELNALQVQSFMSAEEVFDLQKPFFSKVDHWENLKKHISKHIFEICAEFQLEEDDGTILSVKPTILADETIMVVYQKRSA